LKTTAAHPTLQKGSVNQPHHALVDFDPAQRLTRLGCRPPSSSDEFISDGKRVIDWHHNYRCQDDGAILTVNAETLTTDRPSAALMRAGITSACVWTVTQLMRSTHAGGNHRYDILTTMTVHIQLIY
jgi:hypothetical protein